MLSRNFTIMFSQGLHSPERLRALNPEGTQPPELATQLPFRTDKKGAEVNI